MTTNKTTDPATWTAARIEHLAEEKAFTKQRDALSAARRELPWLKIDTDYRFDSVDGEVSLLDLFGPASQLIVYHFMMGPDWEEGCPSCSFWADNYDGTLEHLAARDTALIAVARAPLPAIEAYQKRMGWDFPWVSSAPSSFNFDFGVSFSDEQVAAGEAAYNFGTQTFGMAEAPGISVFRREAADIYLTYQTFSRGLDMLNGTYHLLDLTSKGRDEGDGIMAWLQRRDAY